MVYLKFAFRKINYGLVFKLIILFAPILYKINSRGTDILYYYVERLDYILLFNRIVV